MEPVQLAYPENMAQIIMKNGVNNLVAHIKIILLEHEEGSVFFGALVMMTDWIGIGVIGKMVIGSMHL